MAIRNLPDQAYLRQVFAYDQATGLLTWLPRPRERFKSLEACKTWNARFAGAIAGCKRGKRGSNKDYRVVAVDGPQYLAHRLIWKIMTGADPIGIDHRDGDSLNNRWDNLREATQSQNQMNRIPSGKWPRGVRPNGGRSFCAMIKVEGKRIYLGNFSSVEAASAAYREAAHRLHGEFARFD